MIPDPSWFSELDPAQAAEPAQVSEKEFEAALEEVTGGTAGSNSLERLLQVRRRDLEQEKADARARTGERNRA